MAFVPTPDTVQCNIRALLLGERVENVVHFKLGTGQINAQEIEIIANRLAEEWILTVVPLLGGGYVFQNILATDLTSENASQHLAQPLVPVVGGAPGETMPGSVALCIGFKTNSRGRSFQGRIYISGMTEGVTFGNVFDTGWVNNIRQAVGEALTATADGTSSTHVVLSRTSNGVKRIEGVVTPVTSYVARDNSVDSMRRRLKGRGR